MNTKGILELLSKRAKASKTWKILRHQSETL